MSDHNRLTVYFYIFLLTSVTACGILGSDEAGGVFKVKPISAVEVALEISGNPGDQIAISREGEERYSFRLNQPDTVIYEAGLQPATTYTWSLTNQQVIGSQALTARRQATTLDTTSSNFTWQTFSFGEHSSSVLYGVSIIDENNIWAVGEIYMNDSTGQADSDIYNAAHWDGENWELKRISVQFRDRLITPKLNEIFTFSSSDIWLSSGVPIHGDGTNWTQYHLFDMNILDDTGGGIESIWGKSSENMFFGGALGSMAHYNGQDWKKIETGTELNFYDIHGNGKQGVVAVASKIFDSLDKAIYNIGSSGKVQSLAVEGIPYPISGIWFDESGVTYIVGSGMYRKPDMFSSRAWQPFHEGITNYYLQTIDGASLNNIVTAGAFGELLHFNGAEWRSFYQGIDGNLYDIDLKNDFAAAVGYDGRQAYITIGKRE